MKKKKSYKTSEDIIEYVSNTSEIIFASEANLEPVSLTSEELNNIQWTLAGELNDETPELILTDVEPNTDYYLKRNSNSASYTTIYYGYSDSTIKYTLTTTGVTIGSGAKTMYIKVTATSKYYIPRATKTGSGTISSVSLDDTEAIYKITWTGAAANCLVKSVATAKPYYSVTVTAGSNGTASGGGSSIIWGGSTTISATANTGYHFSKWTGYDTSTTATRTLTITENRSYTANFVGNTYYVKYNANGGSGSMSTSTHTYGTGSTLTANAFSRTGFTFNGWNTNSGGTGSSYSNKATVYRLTSTNGGTVTLYAQWKRNSYTISTSVNSGSGSVSGSGTYYYGDSYSVTATPSNNYYFSGWTDGTYTNPRTGTISTNNLSFSANFTKYSYFITTGVNSGSGTVSGGGTYYVGDTYTVTANPSTNWKFVSWTDGSTTKSRTGTVTGALSFYANFEQIKHTITVGVVPTGSGSVSGAGTYPQGSSCTLTATNNEGYTFTKWTGDISGTSSKYVISSVSNAITANAQFTELSYKVTYAKATEDIGTVPAAQSKKYWSALTLASNPGFTRASTSETGYTVKFDANGGSCATSKLTAINTISYTAQGWGVTAGTTSIAYQFGGSYTKNAAITLYPSWNKGKKLGSITLPTPTMSYCKFAGWFDSDGTNWGTGGTTITPQSNLDLTARWTVPITTISNGHGTVSGGGDYLVGRPVQISAIPNNGYELSQWSIKLLNGTSKTYGAEVYDITAVSGGDAGTYTASFEISKFNVILQTSPDGYGKIVDEDDNEISLVTDIPYLTAYSTTKLDTIGELTIGNQTFTAYPNPGYYFDHWSSTSGKITERTTITAYFGIKRYTITTQASPTTAGTASGSGSYLAGTNVELRATPNEHYQFKFWDIYQDEGEHYTSSENPLYLENITHVDEGTYTASFLPDLHTITFKSDKYCKVDTTTTQKYYGTTYTIDDNKLQFSDGSTTTASSTSEEYHFDKWLFNKNSNDSEEQVITGDTTITVTSALNNYTIIGGCLPQYSGIVTVQATSEIFLSSEASNIYKSGTQVTITETAKTGYTFWKWRTPISPKLSNELDLTQSSFTFTANKYTQGAYTALYQTDMYSVQFTYLGKGTVSPNMILVPYGTTYTMDDNVLTFHTSSEDIVVKADPASTYYFAYWCDKNNNPITSGGTITQNNTLIKAVFIDNCDVNISASTGGWVDRTYLLVNYGTTFTTNGNKITFTTASETITVTAYPDDDYRFLSWSGASSKKIKEDTNIKANFISTKCTVSFTATTGGEVDISKVDAEYGDTFTVNDNKIVINDITITASPVGDYSFIGWDYPSSKTITTNTTITAKFRQNHCKFTFVPNSEDYGSTDPEEVSVEYGATYSAFGELFNFSSSEVVTAIPNLGYTLSYWEPDSGTATHDTNINVYFIENGKCVVKVITEFGGTISIPALEVEENTDFNTSENVLTIGEVEILAEPLPGYHFIGWSSESGTIIENTTITAYFEVDAYTITWELNGGTTSEELPATKNYGETITMPRPEWPTQEKVFVNWSYECGSESGNIEADSLFYKNDDVLFSANWLLQTYTVTYFSNGGELGSEFEPTQTKYYGSELILYGDEQVSRQGYVFREWCTTATSEQGGDTYAGYTAYTKNEDVTLYALWDGTVVNVNYDNGIARHWADGVTDEIRSKDYLYENRFTNKLFSANEVYADFNVKYVIPNVTENYIIGTESAGITGTLSSGKINWAQTNRSANTTYVYVIIDCHGYQYQISSAIQSTLSYSWLTDDFKLATGLSVQIYFQYPYYDEDGVFHNPTIFARTHNDTTDDDVDYDLLAEDANLITLKAWTLNSKGYITPPWGYGRSNVTSWYDSDAEVYYEQGSSIPWEYDGSTYDLIAKYQNTVKIKMPTGDSIGVPRGANLIGWYSTPTYDEGTRVGGSGQNVNKTVASWLETPTLYAKIETSAYIFRPFVYFRNEWVEIVSGQD